MQKSSAAKGPEPQLGTLVAHHGIAVDVQIDGGDRRSVRVKRRSGHVVGDRVRLVGDRLERLERDNELKRRSPGGGVHVVAANIDVLGVVVAVTPPPRVGLVERCVVAARAKGITPVVIVNKADLEGSAVLFSSLSTRFHDHVVVLSVSAQTGQGRDALAAIVRERGRLVFAGHSGGGKSSLTNLLLGRDLLSVGQVSDATGKGRHTTTVATLHALDDGGELIDTPGVREFGLVDISEVELAEHFLGFDSAGACRFRNCLHNGEPACGVERAVADGRLSEDQLVRYRLLLKDLREA